MKLAPDLTKWLIEWENPEYLDTQNLAEYEWTFLASLKNRFKELFDSKICPAVDSYVKEVAIHFGDDGDVNFSARDHLFINSMNLMKLRDRREWEISFSNKLDYTTIHVYLVDDEIDYVAFTF